MQNFIAIIDLGTNTFHLLIARVENNGYEIIYREKQAVKIGVGGINNNFITPDAAKRALETIRIFKSTIDALGAMKIFAFGTSALRNAQNGNEIVAAIKSLTGIEVQLISGDREAEFICYGIRAALSLGLPKVLIMDIGGGSVEFIICNAENIFWKRSFEIGGQRLLEQFQKNDPISNEEISTLDNYFKESLTELFDAIRKHQPVTLVGSSGTFDTLSEIHCQREGIASTESDPELPLTFSAFDEIYSELITKNREQRLAIPGMIEMRVDMIVVACCLIRFILENHTFNNIRVSSYSLKEGALAYLSKTL